jgi:opacity protein-like surface antigen
MGGLRYETEVSPTADLYGLGQVGININRTPTVEASYDDVSATTSSSTVTSTGFTIGAGVAFSDQIDVSIRYLKLGTPEITRETEVQFDGETEREEDEYDQPLAAIQLLVGVDL